MLQLNLFDIRDLSSSEQLILKLNAPVLQKAKLIVDGGNAITQLIAQGRQISPAKLSHLMNSSLGGTDAQGVWQWKYAFQLPHLELGRD